MCFMLVVTPDPRTLKDALPSFADITHIFLPVNDSRTPNVAEAGSHWSLLVVSLIDDVAIHYDSLNPSNRLPAHIASDKLSQLLAKPLKFMDLTDSPQQENGSDCGVFVCLLMRHLLEEKLLKSDADHRISMSMAGEKVDAGKGRKDMLKLIEGFRKEGKRSQSRSRSPFRGDRSSTVSPPRVGD